MTPYDRTPGVVYEKSRTDVDDRGVDLSLKRPDLSRWTPGTVLTCLVVIIVLVFSGFIIRDYSNRMWIERQAKELIKALR